MRNLSGIRPVIALLCLIMCLPSAAAGEAEPSGVRSEFMFGQFSVALPEGAVVEKVTSDSMSMERQVTSNPTLVIRANWAPADSYGEASAMFRANVSWLYAMLAVSESDQESPVTEATLPGSISAAWQTVRTEEMVGVVFEAFTPEYGFSMCVSGRLPEVTVEMLEDLCKSFRFDETVAKDRTEIRQTKDGERAYISADHALRISPGEGWNIADPLLAPQVSFALEKDGATQLIMLTRYERVPDDDVQALYDWYCESQQLHPGKDALTYGVQEKIRLMHLKVEGILQEVHTADGIAMLNLCFVYRGCGFVGSFMWVESLGPAFRFKTYQAIHTLSPV